MNGVITADNVAHSCMAGLRNMECLYSMRTMKSESLRNFVLLIRVIYTVG